MKKQLLPLAIVFLSATAVFTSCKKDENNEVAPAAPVCKVTNVKDLETTDSTVMIYDSQNRLIKSIVYDETGKLLDTYDTYTYAPDKITYTYYSDATTIAQKTEYILNPDGTLKFTAEKDVDEENNVTKYDTAFYTYDSQGYNSMIVYKTEYKGAHNNVYYDTSWNTFTDGNMTSSTVKYYSGETKIEKFTYTSLVDKASVLDGSSLGFSNLYGTPNKNLPLLGTDDEGSYTEKHTYEFNSEGYLTRRRMEYVNTKYPDTYTNDLRFYYTCK